MKSIFIRLSITIILLLTVKVSPSLSEPVLTDTITLTHQNISSVSSGNILTKTFNVQIVNISSEVLIDTKITLSYAAGFLGDTMPPIIVGNISPSDTITLNDDISLKIDRSQLTDGLSVYTWLVEYNTLQGEHIVDEYLIEETE